MRISLWFITIITSISFIYCNQELVLNQTWFDGSPKISEIDLGNNIFEVTYYTKSSKKVYSYKYKSDGSETIKPISIQYYKDGVEKQKINFTKSTRSIEGVIRQIIVADYELEKAKINYYNNNKEKLLINTVQDEFESTSEYLSRIESLHLEYLIDKREYLKKYRDNLLEKYSLRAETINFSISLIGDYDIYTKNWESKVVYDGYNKEEFNFKLNLDRNKAKILYDNIDNVNIIGYLVVLPNFEPLLFEFTGNENKSGFEFNKPPTYNIVFENGFKFNAGNHANIFKDGIQFSPYDYICAFWNADKRKTLIYDLKLNESTYLNGSNPIFLRDGEYVVTTKELYSVNTGEVSKLHYYQDRYYGNNLISDGLSLSVMTINADSYSDLFIYNNLDKKYIYDSKGLYEKNGQRPWKHYNLYPKSIFHYNGKLRILFYNDITYSPGWHGKIREKEPILFLWDIDSKSILWEINSDLLNRYIEELGMRLTRKGLESGGAQNDMGIINIRVSNDKKYVAFNITSAVDHWKSIKGFYGVYDLNTGELVKLINNETNGYFYNFTIDNNLLIKHGKGLWGGSKTPSYSGNFSNDFVIYDFKESLNKIETYKISGLKNKSNDFGPNEFSFSFDKRFVASGNPSDDNVGREWKRYSGIIIQYVPQLKE